jgi:hypothetical protein
MADIAVGIFPVLDRTRGLIPHYQRQILRAEFAADLCAFRIRKGYEGREGLRRFARVAKVSMNTMHDLEAGRRTLEYVTLLTIHKLAHRHGADVDYDDAHTMLAAKTEPQYGATTTLEEFWGMGICLKFSDI